MLKSKSILENNLEKQFINIASDNKLCNDIYNTAKERYNIPKGIVSDYVCMRESISEANEFVLYCILEVLIDVAKIRLKVEEYYTEQEIKMYKESKFEVDKIKFPLRFKMIQIEEDQWIGKVNVKELMKLRAAQKINYNTNAQRNMTRIVKGTKEIYKITLNKFAVNEIESSMEKEEFVPNTITLNIPFDSDNEFYYDEAKCELVINKLEHFFIPDGYHRLISLYKASDKNKDFNYNMELRIVNWTDDKSRTFIWQENNRTPIKKINSESLNMNKSSNIIVERLNNNVNCNIKGMIKRNGGNIDFSELSELVNWFYIKNKKIKKGNENIIQIASVKELTENINIITESDLSLLNKKWDYKFLLSLLCCIKYFKDNNKNNNELYNVVIKTYDNISNSKDPIFKNKSARNKLIEHVINVIDKII